MGRYIAPLLDNLADVTVTNPIDGQSLSFDAGSGEWIKGDTLEQTANKNTPNGYAGLDANGDIDTGTF